MGMEGRGYIELILARVPSNYECIKLANIFLQELEVPEHDAVPDLIESDFTPVPNRATVSFYCGHTFSIEQHLRTAARIITAKMWRDKVVCSMKSLELPAELSTGFAIFQTFDKHNARIVGTQILANTIKQKVPHEWFWIAGEYYNISTDEMLRNVKVCNVVRIDVPVEIAKTYSN